jgi:hypothetical protein
MIIDIYHRQGSLTFDRLGEQTNGRAGARETELGSPGVGAWERGSASNRAGEPIGVGARERGSAGARATELGSLGVGAQEREQPN